MKFIMGPCAIESRDHALMMAETLKTLEKALKDLGFPAEIIYKSSYSKPNRSNGNDFKGVGVHDGIRILQEVKETFEMQVTSDIHTLEEARLAGEVLDIVQIPHQLCKNTPLVQAAAMTGKNVSIKKGTFYDAKLFHNIAKKVRDVDNKQAIIAIERGNHFGYGNTVVDMRNLGLIGKNRHGYDDPGVIVCLDATHPGCGPDGARLLARAGVGAGADMLFLEVHDNPGAAPCDGKCMLPLEGLGPFMVSLCRIREVVSSCVW